MSNCGNSGVNSQMKAMQARLDRIDDDLIAHYAGISQLVVGLAANPLTAAAAASSLRIYNFSSAGQNLLRGLLGLIPGVDKFRQLQHIDAAGRVAGMADAFKATAANMAVSAAEQASLAVQQKIDAEIAYAQALANGLAQEALAPLLQKVDEATNAVNMAASAASAIEAFITTISDIGSCRSRSMALRP